MRGQVLEYGVETVAGGQLPQISALTPCCRPYRLFGPGHLCVAILLDQSTADNGMDMTEGAGKVRSVAQTLSETRHAMHCLSTAVSHLPATAAEDIEAEVSQQARDPGRCIAVT